MTEPTNAQSLENIIGDPIFKQNIGYAYDGNKNIFTFFTPGPGRRMIPIGMFSSIVREGIPYDPEHICETIAEQISTFDFEDMYDIESLSLDEE